MTPVSSFSGPRDKPVVVVIGGGPAGSAASIEAARRGAGVVLLERGGAGRDKPCGDALVHEAVSELRLFGLNPGAPALQGSKIPRMTFASGSGKIWERAVKDGCWIVRRCTLDQAFRDRSGGFGVEVRTHTKALGIEPAGNKGFNVGFVTKVPGEKVLITGEIWADSVVLAHGATSSLSRSWGLDGKALRAPAISRYATEVQTDDALHFNYLGPEQPGYRWVFPGRTGANIGVFALSRDVLRAVRSGEKYPNAGWRGGYEPLWSGKGDTWHHRKGIVSCGDAAGVVDPLTGEGIGPALLTGRKAGAAAADFAATGRQEQLEQFSLWVEEWATARFQAAGSRILLRDLLHDPSRTLGP
ncbi:FAD-dependent oxidoreductase [Streptomyces sp. NPDC051546]|uniref:FAD-dependent oxidoreductase n=1 Tax=Streptomyces sp. NPDC051546 TaxID=3365655 RepID=UPI0037BC849A